MTRVALGCRIALACAFVPAMIAAQESPAPAVWAGVLYYDVQQIAPSPDRAYWHTVTAGIQRSLPSGSIGLQALGTRRFDVTDQAIMVDFYHELWAGAYANLRARYAPDADALPDYHATAELFQSVGRMELWGSYQRQKFPVTVVNTFGIGTGHYVGSWYIRPRSVVAQIGDSWSPSVAISARRYHGDETDDFLDLTAGLGEEVLEVGPPPGSTGSVDVITSASRFAAARMQRFLHPKVGGFVGANYSAYENIPDRWGISVGLITRW